MFSQSLTSRYRNNVELEINYHESKNQCSFHLVVGYGIPDVDNGSEVEFCYISQEKYRTHYIDVTHANKHWEEMLTLIRRVFANGYVVKEVHITVNHENGHTADKSAYDKSPNDAMICIERFKPYQYDVAPQAHSCSLL